ncbi:stalk domain-containing protein [Paenibacillus sp. MMS20-IR301]|uniref:stalk domain-containing protein n=1 Tax=Paenibacillus sp. MMS20-IR301 TaxID=2895946 RepID=UPI0028E1B3C8|nr:stalk domain-containing protein [Paenibacillus sp. MMS20-IR301]WNS41648.1 GDSL-type esterase/lipase family protein [Paenibacillus sp. MMS20-IR301]
MLKAWRKFISAGTLAMMMFAALMSVHAGPAGAAAAAVAQDPEQDIFRIVALGDSITAGYEPGMTDPNVKPYGYAERLLEQGWYHGRTELSNYGILGLKTAGLLAYTTAVKDGAAITAEGIQAGLRDPRISGLAALTPQIRTELAAADLVTITIGGNDVSSLFMDYKTLTDADFAAQLAERLTEYSSNVKSVLDNIRAVNPQAAILLADQYQPAPRIALGASYDKLMNAAAQFTAAAENIAAGLNQAGAQVKVAHVAAQFAGVEGSLTHIIGAGAADFHPTQLGYEKIARVFAELQWGEYRTPAVAAVASAAAPMAIVVKGIELNTPNKPILKNGQNFLALKDILNAVGANGKWDNKTSSATIIYGGRTVIITIGAKTIKVNGADVAIDTPAFLQKVGKEDKTYLPLAALATGLGFDVNYSSKLRTAFINP